MPKEKVVSFAELQTERNFNAERTLRYYQEHAQEFEMFATGGSHAWAGLDVTHFNRKLFNFAKSNQDLYYNYNIAKKIMLYGRGHNTLRYALIEFAPFSFHFDVSKSFNIQWQLFTYAIALNDLHNLPIPIEIYKKFLNEKYLTKKYLWNSLMPINLTALIEKKKL